MLTWWACYTKEPVTQTQCLPNTDRSILQGTPEHLVCEWSLQQAALPSVLLIAAQGEMFVFKLPRLWVICHYTELFRQLSFNRRLQKEKELLLTCARSFMLEQLEKKEKHFKGTDLEMTEVAVPRHLQFNAPTQFSSILKCLRTIVPHSLILQSSVSEVKLCPLDGNYKFNGRPHATTMHITSGDGTALCALFLPVGKLLKIPDNQRKQFIYLSEKRGAELALCFHNLEVKKKKINLPSTPHSDCLIQCCDQSAKV